MNLTLQVDPEQPFFCWGAMKFQYQPGLSAKGVRRLGGGRDDVLEDWLLGGLFQ
ncbi:MAG TPA: hypothetical protein VFZ09_44890 [Archangium sp.]|uniref:hypothetical protein n=1 Tax=Archangium sp. TaxID=1872627 RepID=UPI002E2F89DF|nr:hypothetical protein [Archangium sp.]HEX5753419.1 hypothetical protein [Archangium sp.]